MTIIYTRSVLTAIFPTLLLSLFLDCPSFWDRPKLSMSSLPQSHQVLFGRPHCLIPSASHVIQRLTQFDSDDDDDDNVLIIIN